MNSPNNLVIGFCTSIIYCMTMSKPDTSPTWHPRYKLIQWSAGSSDMVLIELGLLDALGVETEQRVSCIVPDTGSFTVPASAWVSWPTGRQVNLMVSKLKESTGTIEFNNSESRMSGVYTIYGAGFSN